MNTNMERATFFAYALTVALTASFASASGQINAQQCLSESGRVAKLLGIPFDKSSATSRRVARQDGGASWSVAYKQTMVVVDDRSGRFMGLVYGDREDQIRRGIGRTYSNTFVPEAKAWQRGEQILQVLGHHQAGFVRGSFRAVPDSPGGTANSKSRVHLSFIAKPHGYQSNGNGNQVSLAIDAQDGAVVNLRVITGWTYDAPNVKLSQAQAIQRARKVANQFAPSSAQAQAHVVLAYITTNGEFGAPRGMALLKAKRSRLAYAVALGSSQFFIAAETGETLGGGTVGRTRKE